MGITINKSVPRSKTLMFSIKTLYCNLLVSFVCLYLVVNGSIDHHCLSDLPAHWVLEAGKDFKPEVPIRINAIIILVFAQLMVPHEAAESILLGAHHSPLPVTL